MAVVLALDLASRTGWAVGEPFRLPVFGSFRVDAPRDGARFMMLARKVSELIVAHSATELVLEAPHVGGGTRVALPLFGLRAAALMAAEAKGLPDPKLIAPASWRKAFVGHGRLKRTAAKAATIERCRWLGHEPKNDDEADALGLWHFRCSAISSDHIGMTMRRNSFAAAGASGDSRDPKARSDRAPDVP